MQKPDPVYDFRWVFHPEDDPCYVNFENADKHPFEAAATEVSRLNAWWLAESALLAYWDKKEAKRIFKERAGLDSDLVDRGSAECYLAFQQDFVIVAFRGTESDEWDDILNNAQIQPTPWTAGKVHTGFKHYFDKLWKELEPRLQKLAKNRTVWFCGHSLGGALAVLAAHRWPTTSGVCTIGCPRVGDGAFASDFDGRLAPKSLRYVNNNDIITAVPLTLRPPFDYTPVGRARFIAADGTISRAPSRFRDFVGEIVGSPEAILQLIESLRKTKARTGLRALLDHMPKAYAIWMWNDHEKNLP